MITAAEARIRMGTALRTLDVANHRGRGPECPHRPDLGAGAEREMRARAKAEREVEA